MLVPFQLSDQFIGKSSFSINRIWNELTVKPWGLNCISECHVEPEMIHDNLWRKAFVKMCYFCAELQRKQRSCSRSRGAEAEELQSGEEELQSGEEEELQPKQRSRGR